MEKNSISGNVMVLPPLMLVVMFVFGLISVSCDNGSSNYDRTIEELFARTKGEGVFLTAITSTDVEYDYCSSHQRWEEMDNHRATPDFKLADAVQLTGWCFPSTPTAVYIPAIAKILPILNSFFAPEYKTNQPTVNTISAPGGTTVYGWYCFALGRNGVGIFGGTTQTIQSPCMADYYYF